MNLPLAPPTYSQADQAAVRSQLTQADKGYRRTVDDIDLKDRRLFVYSPNGQRWQIGVSNSGAIAATAA